ncbi:hypothetical protein ACJ73_03064 [Blastomyces percursus]|uniref:Cytochrome P450 n=1 Tax=Blastomyces percursus TaxID=1658174 RepID=A0A1J9RAM5_9EURO|nr:hypothetical protein ACJ73_03064 [Blastomyces percursus]
MGYAVIHLAPQPEWQDWIREELQMLDLDPLMWNYEEVYPKCRRTLALMVHLGHPLPIPLSIRHRSMKTVIPTSSHPMQVMVCQLSMHLDPAIWGADASEFRPSRCIDTSGELFVPPKGSYLPWSSGPRICPGLKMSQVKFVAVMAAIFRSARCEPLPTAGIEKPEALRRRLRRLTRDSVSKLTLQLRNAGDVKLQWTAV